MPRDHANLSGLALALAADKRCPMCDNVGSWTVTKDPVEIRFREHVYADGAIALVCGKCGFLTLFLAKQLDAYGSELNADTNGH